MLENLLTLASKAGELVGYCFHLSTHAVAAALAVLKAGCVLVPLDLNHPFQRHLNILRSSSASMLITDSYETSDQETFGIPVVRFDRPDDIQSPTSASSSTLSSPEITDAAQLCFTSGSTGRPKGIVQTHSGLVTMAKALVRHLQITPQSRIAGLHPYVFDVSTMEIFTVICAGATLCIPRREEMMIPKPLELGAALNNFSVTHVVTSPTMIETLDPSQLPDVEVVASMGEPPNRNLLEKWGGRTRPKFFQLYGATEASILQTCTRPLQVTDVPLNIGWSVANTCKLWITRPDDHSRLVPIGAIGELLIEGPSLAQGYLHDPEKTAEHFIPHPRWIAQDRYFPVYKTGDLARHNPDGSVTFVGRLDSQINFHGERVELGEIDYRLKQLELTGVSDIFADFVPESHTFVAFVCLVGQDAVDTGDDDISCQRVSEATLANLRTALRGARARLTVNLPHYVVPSLYIPLRARPLTATDKTDRKAIHKLVRELPSELSARFEGLDE